MKEYNNLRKEFEKDLPRVIRENEIDDWTYLEYGIELQYGVRFSRDCQTPIQELLTKLTKNKNKKWVEHISGILDYSIRGLAKSVSYMTHLGEDVQQIFLNREVCNLMITNMIKTMLFDTDDSQWGDYELDKLRYFTCPNCKKDVDFLDENMELCLDCLEQNININNNIKINNIKIR